MSDQVREESYGFIVNVGNVFFVCLMLGAFAIMPWLANISGWQILTNDPSVRGDMLLWPLLWVVPGALLVIACLMLWSLFDDTRRHFNERVILIAAIVGLLYYVVFLLGVVQGGNGDQIGFAPLIVLVGLAATVWQMRTARPVLVLLLAIVFALFPIIWVISAAFNPSGSMASQTLIPRGVDSLDDLLVNFRDLLSPESLQRYPFWLWMRNTIFVATVTAFFSTLISALAAYAFSRFRFHGRQNLLVLVLLIQVFPNMLAMVALFLILQQIGKMAEYIPQFLPALSFVDWSFFQYFGLDSLGGLILVYLGGAMGINTWLMKGFFDSVPREIDESAQVDGASHWQTFWQLIFPLVRPILAVVAILSFVGTFNEFLLARVLLVDKDTWTVMVGLYLFVSDNFAQNWGKFAAGALISATPIVVLYLLLQDQIVGGLTQGSVKG